MTVSAKANANRVKRGVGCRMSYHGDADGVVELPHEDADDGRRQQQQDQRVFELEGEDAQ